MGKTIEPNNIALLRQLFYGSKDGILISSWIHTGSTLVFNPRSYNWLSKIPPLRTTPVTGVNVSDFPGTNVYLLKQNITSHSCMANRLWNSSLNFSKMSSLRTYRTTKRSGNKNNNNSSTKLTTFAWFRHKRNHSAVMEGQHSIGIRCLPKNNDLVPSEY